MIYKFRSKATGDVIMLGPNGDALLRALGRDAAAQGIIEVAAMPAALAALEAAIAADDDAPAVADDASAAADASGQRGISTRQRLWPMVEMLRRAHAAGEPVTWGV